MRNHSYPPSPEPILIIFRRVAPSIVGIARKKENSVARTLLSPRRTPPIIVAADLEVPGTSARHWKTPISTAVIIGSSAIFLNFSFLILKLQVSTHKKIMLSSSVGFLESIILIRKNLENLLWLTNISISQIVSRFRSERVKCMEFIKRILLVIVRWVIISRIFWNIC